jgi:hypothetical protein
VSSETTSASEGHRDLHSASGSDFLEFHRVIVDFPVNRAVLDGGYAEPKEFANLSLAKRHLHRRILPGRANVEFRDEFGPTARSAAGGQSLARTFDGTPLFSSTHHTGE